MLQEKLSSNRQLRLFALGALWVLRHFYWSTDLCRWMLQTMLSAAAAMWKRISSSTMQVGCSIAEFLSFPLCVTTAIQCAPGHQYCVYRSIPLVALLCKPLASLLGGTFQYFGWFTLLCFALQGGFGALALRPFLPGHTPPGAGDPPVCFQPPHFVRAGVSPYLSGGTMDGSGSAVSVFPHATPKGRYASLGLFLLNVAAIGIHPYFLPMTYGITLALLLQHSAEKRQWKGPCLYLAADLLCTLGLGWLLGFFYGTATSGGQALYGYFP